MPVITVEAGPLTKEQKAELTKTLTESASRIMGIPEHAFITLLKENAHDNVGVGGVLLSDRKK